MFFLLSSFQSLGQQNLILNGDFEEYWECPDALTQIARCKYVYNPCLPPNWQPPQWSSTSDYFNACSSQFDCGTPSNTFGYQHPKSGKAYVGLTHSESFSNYKEYIQLSFSEVLKPYATYQFSIFVSVSDAVGWSANFMQFKFTDTLEYFNTYLSDVMSPDITLSSLNLMDSLLWTKLSFDYIAKGNEKYIIIGDFNVNSSNDCFYAFQGSNNLLSNPVSGAAYFLFDDASLVLIKEAEPITLPNVFTPNDDGINDILEILTGKKQVESIIILNRWGNVVYESYSDFTWDGTDFHGNKVNQGVYFVIITTKVKKEGKKEHYQGMVRLIR